MYRKIAATTIALVLSFFAWRIIHLHPLANIIDAAQIDLSYPCELEIILTRTENYLVWKITNKSSSQLWAFLLLPALANGLPSVSLDRVHVENVRDDVVLLRKVYNAQSETGGSDSFERTGALLLSPGETRQGNLLIDATIRNLMFPNGSKLREHGAFSAIMEVGWIPMHINQMLEHSSKWIGGPFAYINPERESGGQRYCRSSEFRWND